jgi:hypothetical protein
MNSYQIAVIIGFLAVGFYRYIHCQTWDIRLFLRLDYKVMLRRMLFTVIAAYFAHDIASVMPGNILGTDLHIYDAMMRAPKLAGFTIGVLGAGSDLLTIIRNSVELIPVVGPKLIHVFSKPRPPL